MEQVNEKVETIDTVMFAIDELLGAANAKMSDIVKGNFPYKYEDVVLTVDADSAGIYIKSGSTPVVAVARAGNPEGVLREIKSKVWEEVDATRTAVERRGTLKDEMQALAEDEEKQKKAAEALKAAGLSVDMLSNGINPEAAEAVVNAAKKAVRDANRGLFMVTGATNITIREAKLTVKGFAGGVVILAGGKPCLVSRFPKLGNAKTIERTCSFIKADVAALNENRRKYFMYVRQQQEREERLHELSARIDAVNDDLMVAAAM